MAIKSNDLKKGDVVIMKGTNWYAVIEDNKKGNIRMATVAGVFTEMGSIYVWDIAKVIKVGGKDVLDVIELTPKQAKEMAAIKAVGLGF